MAKPRQNLGIFKILDLHYNACGKKGRKTKKIVVLMHVEDNNFLI